MARKNLRIKKKKKTRRHGKQKVCFFSKTGMVAIDYKDEELLRRFVTERGPTHATHCLELLGRGLGNVRVVNLSRRTPRVRGDSPAAR